MIGTGSSNHARRRLGQESGFTIVEMMVAFTILAVGLVSLAYTASVSFGYSAKARQKQDATGVANQSIEKVRALAITSANSQPRPSASSTCS